MAIAEPKRGRWKLSVDWKLLYFGLFLVGLGLLLPMFFTVETMDVYGTIQVAIREGQEIYVLLAALKLVMLNAVRAYPHYLGVFFLVESLAGIQARRRLIVSILVVCLTIPSVYFLIGRIYDVHYDFGIPALSMITILILLGKVDFKFINLTKKALMVAFLITALQFLDMMPALWGFHFGRGEISYDIKLTARFLNAESFLQWTSTLFFTVLLFMTVLTLMLIVDENNIRKISEQKELNERMLMESRVRILESRTYMELRYLVHDLKSPLTGMQALVGVVKMSCEQKDDAMNVEYLTQVEAGIERVSGMISEILDEGKRTAVTTREFLSGVMAQISPTKYVDMVHMDNQVPERKIKINKIRFSRALVNLIENSAYAVDQKTGLIRVRASAGAEGTVCFTIQDNGKGISPEHMDQIWTEGFSSHSSYGLGLSFVRQVVTQSGGTVNLESVEGEGTVATVTLPPYEEDKEEEI